MAIEAITGKKCTLEIGSTTYTAWVQGLDSSSDKASTTVPTWGEDVSYLGTATRTGELTFLFDPNEGALGAAMEAAHNAETPVTLTVDMGGASRVYTGWQVSAYKDSMPADNLLACTASLVGSSPFVTTYKTAAAARAATSLGADVTTP